MCTWQSPRMISPKHHRTEWPNGKPQTPRRTLGVIPEVVQYLDPHPGCPGRNDLRERFGRGPLRERGHPIWLALTGSSFGPQPCLVAYSHMSDIRARTDTAARPTSRNVDRAYIGPTNRSGEPNMGSTVPNSPMSIEEFVYEDVQAAYKVLDCAGRRDLFGCRQVIWPHCLHEFWPQHLTG